MRGLTLDQEEEADFNQFMKRFMARVKNVKQRGFKVTRTFDGHRLPAKLCTDIVRREIRTKNQKIAVELEAAGQGETNVVHDSYNKSFVVTNALIHRVFK